LLTGQGAVRPDPAPAVEYGGVARALHWFVAGLVAAVVVLGWAMLAAPPDAPRRDLLLLWHRSLGLVTLAVVLFWLAWRSRHPPPPLPSDLGWPTAALARLTQATLCALLIGMPVTGWVNAAAAGHRVSLFGLLSLPPLLSDNGRLSQAAVALHLAGQYLLYGLVALHVSGALYHAVLRRDGVFERMRPWPGPARPVSPARRPPG
jgi:cytochrome b561